MRGICVLKGVSVSAFALAVMSGALSWPPRQAHSQTLPSSLPTKEDLARDNNLFLSLARKALKWDEPADPIKIVGPLYFVGTQGLEFVAVRDAEGHILLNTGMPTSGPLIVESIKQDRFQARRHQDHHQRSRPFRSRWRLRLLQGVEWRQACGDGGRRPPMEDGGKSDFHYGTDWKIMGFPPVTVDRVLRDGRHRKARRRHPRQPTTRRDIRRGSTTWVTTLVDGGKAYKVVFLDGGGFNPGYRIAKPPTDYPGDQRRLSSTRIHFLGDAASRHLAGAPHRIFRPQR